MNEKSDKGREQGAGDARPEGLSPDTLKAMGEELAAVSFSNEEAAAYAPLLDGFTQIIKSIEMHEETEPAVVFRAGKEK